MAPIEIRQRPQIIIAIGATIGLAICAHTPG